VARSFDAFRWVGRGEVLRIGDFEIVDPLTYTGPRVGHPQNVAMYTAEDALLDGLVRTGCLQDRALDPSQIDPALPVAVATVASRLPYWPSYERLSPEQRYLYLSWLALGRESLPTEDGYLFIYYYGLERRALLDAADHGLVITEILRLKKMHAAQSERSAGGSFQNYSSGLLWYLVARHTRHLRVEHLEALVNAQSVWTEETLAAALAWFVEQEYPLCPWLAYVMAEQDPTSQRSVVVRRVNDEFRELFTRRYLAEFGRGMMVRRAKRDRAYTYRPASAILQRVAVHIANALGLPSQFRRLSEIWNECLAELRKFSSVVRDGRPEQLTPEAWEALPAELRSSVEHPLASTFFDLLVSRTDEVGNTFVSAGDLAALLRVERRVKLTLGQSKDLVATAQHAGFALEPDARFSGRAYAWDELLVAFPQAYEGEADYKRYGGAACMLRLGIEIAEADGRVQDEELTRVMGQIQTAFQLNDHERRRLEALRTLLLKVGADVTSLGKRLQAVMTSEGRQALGRLLVAVAGIDGVITRSERAALRRCYRALDLSPDLLESTIAELAPPAGEAPISVVPGRAATPGERIPPPPDEVGIKLDRARIMQVLEETRSVSLLLAEAMNLESAMRALEGGASATTVGPARIDVLRTGPQTGSTEVEPAGGGATPCVPGQYAGLFWALVRKGNWSRAEVDALARQHGQMVSGAVEAINDWAVERVGSPLIYENGDALIIESGLLKELGAS